MQSFFIIRGIPGSGKSSLAKILANAYYANHYETDMWFMVNGVYQFDVNKLQQNHEACKKAVENTLIAGNSVVVSNTFTTKKELVPYFQLAQKFGLKPIVITAQSEFKNVHSVPSEALEKMKARFDHKCVEVLYKEYFPEQ